MFKTQKDGWESQTAMNFDALQIYLRSEVSKSDALYSAMGCPRISRRRDGAIMSKLDSGDLYTHV